MQRPRSTDPTLHRPFRQPSWLGSKCEWKPGERVSARSSPASTQEVPFEESSLTEWTSHGRPLLAGDGADGKCSLIPLASPGEVDGAVEDEAAKGLLHSRRHLEEPNAEGRRLGASQARPAQAPTKLLDEHVSDGSEQNPEGVGAEPVTARPVELELLQLLDPVFISPRQAGTKLSVHLDRRPNDPLCEGVQLSRFSAIFAFSAIQPKLLPP